MENTEKRERTMTAKGKEFMLNMTTDTFLKAKRKIAKMLKLENIGHDSLDTITLDLSLMKECVVKLKAIGMEEQNLKEFEQDIIEIELQIANLVKTLDEDKKSVASVRSKTSLKSKASKGTSVTSHTSKRRVELAAKFARLNTEAKYKDKLLGAMCDLERLKIAQEIEACGAELQAVKQIEEEEFDRQSRSPVSLHLDSDKKDDGLMQQYLEDSKKYSSSSSGVLSPSLHTERNTNKSPIPIKPNEAEAHLCNTDLNPNAPEYKAHSDTVIADKFNPIQDPWKTDAIKFKPIDIPLNTYSRADRLSLPTYFDTIYGDKPDFDKYPIKEHERKFGSIKEEKVGWDGPSLFKEEKVGWDGPSLPKEEVKREPVGLHRQKNQRVWKELRPCPDDLEGHRLLRPDEVSHENKARLGRQTDFDFNHSDARNRMPTDTYDYTYEPRPRYPSEPPDLNTVPPNYNTIPPSSTLHDRRNVQSNTYNNQTTPSSQIDVLREFAYLQHQNLVKIVDLFTTNQRKVNLPVKEPEVFSGDLLSYPMWKASFTTLIEHKTSDASERLYYLSKYTSSEAKASISNLISIGTREAYEKAQKILSERYGNPFNVANAFRNKLERWPKIALNDGVGLRKFYDYLEQCKTAMEYIRYLSVLNDPKENRLMLEKLPVPVAERWNTITTKRIAEPEGEFPSFYEFTQFIGEEARKACNPMTSYNAIHGKGKEQSKLPNKERTPQSKSVQRTSFATKHEEVKGEVKQTKTEVKQTETSQRFVPTCSFCKESHYLEVCKDYEALTLEKRNKFLIDNNICRGCLKHGHTLRYCKRQKVCKICKRWHPTILHNERLSTEANAKDNKGDKTQVSNKIVKRYSTGDITSMIVPVRLACPENNRSVIVYAVLDDQSDASFIQDSILHELNANGNESVINIATMLGEEKVKCKKVHGLTVEGLYENSGTIIDLPCVYSRQNIPAKREQIPTKESALKWPHLHVIAEKLPDHNYKVPIGLLIGANCIDGIKPIEIIPGSHKEPYALKTILGWGVIGNINPESKNDECIVNRTIVEEFIIGKEKRENLYSVPTRTKEIFNVNSIQQMFDLDFVAGIHDEETGLSVEDRKFLDVMKTHSKFYEGHFELPLPLKNEDIKVPNNYSQAHKRLVNFKIKAGKNPTYCSDYCNFMQSIIQKNYAEVVPISELNAKNVWFIPHHGVYHPKKPHKIRVVFDCSCKFKDFCLNENLLQGPDLTNNLVGILCRFRLYPIAFSCDIQEMFHQVKVTNEHKDLLRFLWFSNNDVNGPILQYRMTVHVFGARSSPSVVNFALKSAADKFKTSNNQKAVDFIKDDFYVDDGIKSVKSVNEAITLLKDSQEICKQGGFQLHKYVANHPEILKVMCPGKQPQSVKSLDLTKDELPIDRTLGLEWCTETDTFHFKTKVKERPDTRRGVLSIVSSLFDPLGMISPFILTGKKILQILCKQDLGWDEAIPENMQKEWRTWLDQIKNLDELKIKRSYAPLDVDIIDYQLHHFSDASEKGYGQCSYLRMKGNDGKIYVSLVMSKSRVSPIKACTIPRLELTAALVSVKVSNFLKKELKVQISKEIFWVDSKAVLGYIFNESKRFKVFVANRTEEIRKFTLPTQWKYIPTKCNPADLCSRGITVEELSNSDLWWSGPEFLRHDDVNLNVEYFGVAEDDPEVRVNKIVTVNKYPDILERLSYFSDWIRARKAIAICQKYLKVLQHQNVHKSISVDDLSQAEIFIVKAVQLNLFNDEYQSLKTKNYVSRSSKLYKLDPFIDDDGLIRVGGRLRRGDFDINVKHPVILPKESHITELIIRHYHQKVHHQGRNITLNTIRTHGYWIIKGSTLIARSIYNCVTCRKFRKSTLNQKMADLPKDRIEMSPPFTFAAVDYFGPFYIKEGRKELKRYGVLFTCMSTRAVHIETANSLSTDSFINAYRRFVSRRGPCKQIRSDCGTNFVGAAKEMETCLKEMNNILLKDNCEVIQLKMNPPNASHMGGVWERQIRSVRNILNVLLGNHSKILCDETLRTFMCEAENIINGRPLVTDVLNDPFVEPLTPNHFLLCSKSKVVLPPPGNFVKNDVFSKKNWRRVQYLLNQFWERWRKEYLQSLQVRQKWVQPYRNVSINDIVLIKDYSLPRNQWSLGKVVEVVPDDVGMVRKVKLQVSDCNLDSRGKRRNAIRYLERPIHALILILEGQE